MSNFNQDDLGLPKDPAQMTRKERRKWYHNNKKRFQLPRWRELSKLKTDEHG